MTFYDILRSNWQMERERKDIIRLETDFFEKARGYLNHLKNQIELEEEPLISELFKQRWIRARYLLDDLISLRLEKHIRQTLSKEAHDKEMPYEEKKFRSSLEKLTTEFHDAIVGKQDKDREEEDELTYSLVLFTDNEISITIGADVQEYGPFKKKDLAYLPAGNAAIFENNAKAMRIELD